MRSVPACSARSAPIDGRAAQARRRGRARRAAPPVSGRVRADASAAVVEPAVARRRDRRGDQRAASAHAALARPVAVRPDRGSCNAARAIASASIASDSPRVRPATPLRRCQLRRHPHQPLTCCRAAPARCPRVTCRQSSTAHNRSCLQRPTPVDQPTASTGPLVGNAATELIDGDRSQRLLVYVHSDHDHHRLASYRWRRPASGQTSIEASCQAPIKSRSTVFGNGGDTTLDSQIMRTTFRNRASRRQPEPSNSNQTARAQDDIEFRNDA